MDANEYFPLEYNNTANKQFSSAMSRESRFQKGNKTISQSTGKSIQPIPADKSAPARRRIRRDKLSIRIFSAAATTIRKKALS